MKTSILLICLGIITLVTTSSFGSSISQMTKEDIASSKIKQMNYDPGPGIIAEYTWEYLGSNQVRFTDASTGGGGPVQYAWDFTDDGTDDAWGSTVTYTYPGSSPYYCDHWVRGDDDTQSQVAKPVRWDGGIIAEYTVEYLDDYLVKFTDTSTGGGGPVQYAWDFTDDGTDDAWGWQVTHTYPGPGQYYCDHWVRGDDDTQSQVAKPLRPGDDGGGPGPGIIAEYTWEYLGSNQVTFTDASTGGGGPVQYAWDFTNDGTDDAWGPTVTHTYPGSGPYYCDHWVRGDDDTQSQVAKPVRPGDDGGGIIAGFTWTVNGYTITFTDTSTGGGGVANSAWDFTTDGTDDAWGLVVSHTYPDSSTYVVTHWVKGNDGSESQCSTNVRKITIDTTWGINLHFWENILERFPHIFPLLRHLMGY